jgi:hypothetical protein
MGKGIADSTVDYSTISAAPAWLDEPHLNKFDGVFGQVFKGNRSDDRLSC